MRDLPARVPAAADQVRTGAEHILALFRSIYRLGIRGTERVHYWRLFFWTLFHRPSLFPLAVTLAIYGFHFRRICQAAACFTNDLAPGQSSHPDALTATA